MNITYGYSKDERLDLNQFVYGLVVPKEGLPRVGTVNDGNISDKKWNLEVIREIQQGFLDPAELWNDKSAKTLRGNCPRVRKAGFILIFVCLGAHPGTSIAAGGLR